MRSRAGRAQVACDNDVVAAESHPDARWTPPPVELSAQGDHLAFYRFVAVSDVEAAVARTRELTVGLSGSVLIAAEGVNGMLAGTPERIDAFLAAASTDGITAPLFDGITVKRTMFTRPPFRRMLVKAKKEIVPLGVADLDMPNRMDEVRASDVTPRQWRELITRDDVVVLDNRNSFEHGVGHFAGAVDPGVENFRDFTDYVERHAAEWKREGKTVAMYCTGGIRCEKSSPWMQDLGLEVRQLQGGVLNYFAQMPDAEKDWHGECFVFDERGGLDTKLRETSPPPPDMAAPSHHRATDAAATPARDLGRKLE